MLKINRKEDFRITEENIEMDSVYASKTNLFYVFKSYADNRIEQASERYCYVQLGGIKDRGTQEYKGSFNYAYKTKAELVSCLNSYSCKPIDIEINEI